VKSTIKGTFPQGAILIKGGFFTRASGFTSHPSVASPWMQSKPDWELFLVCSPRREEGRAYQSGSKGTFPQVQSK